MEVFHLWPLGGNWRSDEILRGFAAQSRVEVDALHAKAEDFSGNPKTADCYTRMTRVHKSDEAADKLRRDNLRMVSKLHTVLHALSDQSLGMFSILGCARWYVTR
eukprot:4824416-Amphidinium_carterae.1